MDLPRPPHPGVGRRTFLAGTGAALCRLLPALRAGERAEPEFDVCIYGGTPAGVAIAAGVGVQRVDYRTLRRQLESAGGVLDRAAANAARISRTIP